MNFLWRYAIAILIVRLNFIKNILVIIPKAKGLIDNLIIVIRLYQ